MAVVLAAPVVADILIAAGVGAVVLSASKLLVDGVEMTIEKARELAEEARRKREIIVIVKDYVILI